MYLPQIKGDIDEGVLLYLKPSIVTPRTVLVNVMSEREMIWGDASVSLRFHCCVTNTPSALQHLSNPSKSKPLKRSTSS